MRLDIKQGALWVVMLSCVAGFCVLGCGLFEPKYPSPVTGKPLTALEMIAEQNTEKAKKDEHDAAEKLRIEQERDQAKADLAHKVLDADRAYKAKLESAKRANSNAQANADAARSEYEAALAAVDREGRTTVESLTLKFNAMQDRQAQEAAKLEGRYSVAFQGLETRATQQTALVNAAASLGNMIPGAAPLLQSQAGVAVLGLLGGGSALGILSRNGRKQSDAAYDEGYAKAKAEAEQQRQREHEAWDNSANAVLMTYRAPPALPPAHPSVPVAPAPATTGA